MLLFLNKVFNSSKSDALLGFVVCLEDPGVSDEVLKFWTTEPLFSCRVNNTVALPTAHILFLLPQDPKPTSVDPAKGPAAGGTVITIGGQDLDTATKDDVTVAVGGVPCEVYVFTAVCFFF